MHMKIKRTGCAALTALLILTNAITISAEDAPEMPENAVTADTAAEDADAVAPDAVQADGEKNDGQTDDAASPGADDTLPPDAGTMEEPSDETPDGGTKDEPSDEMPDAGTTDEPSGETPDGNEADVPQEPPAFSAHVEWTGGNGYVVRGTFTEFTDDIVSIQPMYALDGEAYRLCTDNLCWDLRWIGTDDPDRLRTLQNQICLVSNVEPFKSYLAGTLDRFYIRLRITKENGKSYETKAAVIDRGEPQPLPEGIRAILRFDSTMIAGGWGQPRYGKYQITVDAGATPGEIVSYLPGTVPVEICLTDSKSAAYTEGVIDCPVSWKPLTLPSLVPGESVTISDAAGEIIVPAGTMLRTPLGIFRLEEACSFDSPYYTDDIDLVLNVVAEDAAPTGALSEARDGLELAFDFKPTGARTIQAYTCREGDTQWTKLPSPLSLDALDSQPKTANSGYALVLGSDTEPYRTYLAQKDAGNPTPFYVGVEIEGGVYDKKQLILAWPDSYDLPLALPKLGGSGGNENNAGSGDKDDSTETGQRPNLPGDPSGSQEGPSSASPGTSSGEEMSGTPEQTDPQSPDASKPGESGTGPGEDDSQSPGQSGPGEDEAGHDRPKPVRPDGKDTDNAGGSAADTGTEKTGTEKDFVSDTKASTTKHPVTDAKAGTAKNSAAEDKTRAPEKSGAAQNPAADGGEHTPSAQIPVKKAGEGDTPALPDLLPDDDLHTDSKEDLLLAQAGRTGNAPSLRPDRTEAPARTGGDSHPPLLPAAAAVALFWICIAGAKKFTKK